MQQPLLLFLEHAEKKMETQRLERFSKHIHSYDPNADRASELFKRKVVLWSRGGNSDVGSDCCDAAAAGPDDGDGGVDDC